MKREVRYVMIQSNYSA